MDLLDILKDKVEPRYIGGYQDTKETRVAKRVKVFTHQAQRGVAELQVSARVTIFLFDFLILFFNVDKILCFASSDEYCHQFNKENTKKVHIM